MVSGRAETWWRVGSGATDTISHHICPHSQAHKMSPTSSKIVCTLHEHSRLPIPNKSRNRFKHIFARRERERGIPCECKVDREERRGEHKGRSREQYIQRQGQKQERKNKTRKTMNSKTDETAKEKKKRTERRVRVCAGVPSDDLGFVLR